MTEQQPTPRFEIRWLSSLLGQYEGQPLPERTDAACWWCVHRFEGRVYTLPIHYTPKTSTFRVFGIFCSPACSKAYMLQWNDTVHSKAARNHFRLLMLKAYGFGRQHSVETGQLTIRPAPPREMLRLLGGSMDIDEFRRQGTPPNDTVTELLQTPLIVDNSQVIVRPATLNGLPMKVERRRQTLIPKIQKTKGIHEGLSIKPLGKRRHMEQQQKPNNNNDIERQIERAKRPRPAPMTATTTEPGDTAADTGRRRREGGRRQMERLLRESKQVQRKESQLEREKTVGQPKPKAYKLDRGIGQVPAYRSSFNIMSQLKCLPPKQSS